MSKIIDTDPSVDWRSNSAYDRLVWIYSKSVLKAIENDDRKVAAFQEKVSEYRVIE
jgi:hypothetical protein